MTSCLILSLSVSAHIFLVGVCIGIVWLLLVIRCILCLLSTEVLNRHLCSFTMNNRSLSLLTLAALVSSTWAYPTGTGGCLRNGFGSVGYSHQNRPTVISGAFSDFPGRLQVLISENDLSTATLLSPETAFDVEVGKTYTLFITGDLAFRGFLYRLESTDGVDTTIALDVQDGDLNAQVAIIPCVQDARVGGVTHTNNDEKNEARALLTMDEPSQKLLLDVTAVIQNRDVTSEFYFTTYSLNAVWLQETP
jgi:hypothetical protein